MTLPTFNEVWSRYLNPVFDSCSLKQDIST
jgi:hypothetical protein